MKNSYLILSALVLLLFQTQALANPTLSNNHNDDGDFKKNIFKGNQEISLDGALGYSSFSGVNTNFNLTYRYFLADKLSLGPVFGYTYSDLDRSLDIGASGRWYFYESGNFAYSLTQNLVYNSYRGSVPGLAKYSGSQWNGLTQLTSHYFFNSSVYMSMSLDFSYNLHRSDSFSNQTDLSSRIGLGVTF